MSREREKPVALWRPPTRRSFVALLGAGAAALALRLRGAAPTEDRPADDDPPRTPWTGATRWIGHC